ncbi:TonB-dependent receptor [uncultured Bacteroides sp.]|uniref:TonB-dependent receptor n=1 Tax=uncultured Bacteroides sp. TaxID=162156 RepID=UPI0026026BB9|nr:TonB-dependent receptor [uncultured Bacteroides sp.]
MKNNCNFQNLEMGRPLWAFAKKIPLVMKLFIICLFCSIGMVQAVESYAQNARISLKVEEETVADVLKEIEEASEFDFFYNNTQIDLNRRVSVSAQNSGIFSILDEVFAGTKVRYTVLDKKIILSTELADKQQQQQPGNVVKGKVVDAMGEPVIGATVKEVGTNNGIVTDIDGNFSLAVQPGASLEISFVGYKTETVKAVAGKSLAVTLKEDNELLDEVVVVGYGVTKKRDLAGSISSLKTEDIKAGVVTSAAQFLKGRAAGVQVRQNSSEPGGGISIRIRGASSISSNNEPLYVIDGYQTELGNSINPEDIASIEVLKDAAATAIYGARGANGVVIITTKQGTKDHFSVSYSYNSSVKKLNNPWELMDAQDQIAYEMKIWEENGSIGNAPYTQEQLKYKGKGTDWIGLATRTALTQTHQVSIMGGGDKLTMAISANYMDDKGILQNTNFNRFSGRMNLGYKLNDRVRFGSNIYLARTAKNYLSMGTNAATDNVMYSLFTSSPLSTPTEVNVFGETARPNRILEEINAVDFENITNNVYATIYGEVDILKSLTARVSYTYSNDNSKAQKYYPQETLIGQSYEGLATIDADKSDNHQLDALLTYHQNFNDKHDVKFMVGTTYTSLLYEGNGMQGSKFSTDEFSFNNIGAAENIEYIYSNKSKHTTSSFFTRLEYVLRDKYVFNASFRADGASNFGHDNKWGYFPSGSFAWQLGDEEFMEFAKPIFSSIKLRTSYGLAGNDGIGNYLSQKKFAMCNVYLGGDAVVKGMYPSNPGNPGLKWETTSQFDVGLDFTLMDGRIEFNFDYYIKRTKDLLNPIVISTTTGGFETMMGNNGKIENRGFEFFVKSNNISTKDFSWNTTLNISRNRNKVTELNQGEARYYTIRPHGTYDWEEYALLQEGYALSSIYGYVFNGIIQQGETYSPQPTSVPGDPKFVDLDKDGVITDKDRTVIGDGNPDVVLGMGNNFQYRDFDFSFFLDANIGNELLNLSRIVLEDGGRLKESANRWTIKNPSNTLPRNGWNKDAGIQYGSYVNSRYVENASYLRLQSVELGYTLPVKRLGNMANYIKGLRIFVGAQNLFTITDYTGFDPETSTNGGNAVQQGLDFNSYPAYRTFNFGAKITF